MLRIDFILGSGLIVIRKIFITLVFPDLQRFEALYLPLKGVASQFVDIHNKSMFTFVANLSSEKYSFLSESVYIYKSQKSFPNENKRM